MRNDLTKLYPLNLTSIKPRRYVYHVTRASHRLDIMFNGVLPLFKKSEYSLAFANNMHPRQSVGNFWPLPIDMYDISYEYGDWTLQAFFSGYDYWRIDTVKANVEWYIDPFMESDCHTYRCGKPENFICTPSVIHADALDLMEYDMEGYNRFGQAHKGRHPELIYSEFNRMVRYRRERNNNLVGLQLPNTA